MHSGALCCSNMAIALDIVTAEDVGAVRVRPVSQQLGLSYNASYHVLFIGSDSDAAKDLLPLLDG